MRTHAVLYDSSKEKFRIIVKDIEGYWFFYHDPVEFDSQSSADTFADALNKM